MKKFWKYLVLAFGFLAFLPQVVLAQVSYPDPVLDFKFYKPKPSFFEINYYLLIAFLIISLVVEIIFVYIYLKKRKDLKKMVWPIVLVNIVSVTFYAMMSKWFIYWFFPADISYPFWKNFLVVFGLGFPLLLIFETLFLYILTRKYWSFKTVLFIAFWMNLISYLVLIVIPYILNLF